jgi:hypothetical protein
MAMNSECAWCRVWDVLEVVLEFLHSPELVADCRLVSTHWRGAAANVMRRIVGRQDATLGPKEFLSVQSYYRTSAVTLEAVTAAVACLVSSVTELRMRGIRQLQRADGLVEAPLRILDVAETMFTNGGVSSLSWIQSLEALSLERCRMVTNASALSRLRNLRELNVGHTRVTDATLIPALVALPQLERLDVSHTPVTNASVVAASKHGQLKHLAVEGVVQINDEAIKHVATHCPLLESLNVARTMGSIGDSSLRFIGEHCRSLTSIDVSWISGRVSDDSMMHIAQCCPLLKRVAMRMTAGLVTNRTLFVIAANASGLQHLDISECEQAMNSTGVSAVARNCPQLETLLANVADLDDECAQLVASNCTKLAILSLRSNDRISDAGVIAIARGCRRLAQLDVSYNHSLTSAAAREVALCAELAKVHATGIAFFYDPDDGFVDTLRALRPDVAVSN